MVYTAPMIVSRFFERVRLWVQRTPRSFSGSVLANRLGWQLVRVLFLNGIRRLGSYRMPSELRLYEEQLRNEGVITIPDFLPVNVFAEIYKEYEREVAGRPLRPLASQYIIPESGMTRVGVCHFHPEPQTRLYELLNTHLIRNPMVCKLGAAVVQHEITEYRPPQIFMNKKMGDEYPDLNSDMYFHADVSYPGVKAYLYLVDIDETNGAFRYAKGTHKLTWKRWKWEYRKSIEHAQQRARVKNKKILGDETGRSWHCMTREEERREGIVGTSMTGKANTLVVFNVMGFHRRGDFTSDRPRAFAYAHYRDTVL